MIPTAVTASFRWWAQHPWETFWGTLFLCFLILLIPAPLVYFMSDPASHPGIVSVARLVALVIMAVWGLSQIVMYSSFSREMSLMWKRSKIGVILLVVVIAAPTWFVVEMFSARERFGYHSEVELELLRAAKVQELYFAKNHSFKSCVDCTSNDLP